MNRKISEEIMLQQEKERIDRFVKYIEDNRSEIIDEIIRFFDERKKFIAVKMLRKIRMSAQEAKHYEWNPGDCTYNKSGIIKENGKVDKNISIEKFLSEELTGSWTPTYCSGQGLIYDTYNDYFSFDTLELGEDLMQNALKLQLEKAFGEELDEYDMMKVMDECHDEIYDDCPAYEFFDCLGALEYCGVDLSMKLKTLIDKENR